MYVIVVYDISSGCISKVHDFLSTYLIWVQNSVFEGELTEKEFRTVADKLIKLIDEELDSVLIYSVRDEKVIKKTEIGLPKNTGSNII